MRNRVIAIATAVTLATSAQITSAMADAAKPGQSMTHMKTAQGLTATLKNAGVIFYVQGGATAAVMGDSISAPNGQMVFHIPVTGTKTGVEHVGSNIVFFNFNNNQQVQLRNPLIDLKKGLISAAIPQGTGQSTPVLTISNASTLRPKVTTDRKAKLRTSVYSGATLSLAPGIGAALSTLLGLPEGSLPEGLAFGSADVSLYQTIK